MNQETEVPVYIKPEPNTKNYQRLMEQEISRWQEKPGRRPRLLLHSCCAPCSSAVLDALCADFDITLFYYNPNISTEAEFTHRVDELRRFCHEKGIDVERQDSAGHLLGAVEIVVPPYDHREFLAIARGHERDPERGERCHLCYRQRLERTAEYMDEVNQAWAAAQHSGDSAAKAPAASAKVQSVEGPAEETPICGGAQCTHTGATLPFDYFCTTLTLSPLKSSEVLNAIGEEIGKAHGRSFLPSDFKKRGGYQKSIELSKQYDLYRQNFCGCEFSH